MGTIKKILAIEGTKAFSDFVWDASPAARYNLIYGWNRSGKTTLARAIRQLERNIKAPEGLEQLAVSMETADGRVASDSEPESPLEVRVFSEDFINDHFSTRGSRANPIVMLAQESIELQNQLDEVRSQVTEHEERLDGVKQEIHKISDPSAHFTNCAREVGRIFEGSGLSKYESRSYRAPKVKVRIESGDVTADNLDELLITDSTSLESLVSAVKGRHKEVVLDAPPLSSVVKNFEKANRLLTREVELETIDRIAKDEDIAAWVREGFELHKKKELTSCQFCNGEIPKDLLARYGRYFTDEVAATELEIKDSITSFTTLKEDLAVTLPDSSEFMPQLTPAYAAIRPSLESSLTELRQSCGTVLERLEHRSGRVHVGDSMQDPVSVPTEAVETAHAGVDEAQRLIEQQGELLAEGEEARIRAAGELELHTIAKYMQDNNYFFKRTEWERLTTKRDHLKSELDRLTTLRQSVQQRLSSTGVAIEEINPIIAEFVGEDQLELQQHEDEGEAGYRLLSDGSENRFPSEGEKSIISLAYFVTKLGEKGCDPATTVVLLDDPVDSQDGNFLFRTALLVEKRLKGCAQVFILTHNYEFFNLVRDWMIKGEEDQAALFWIDMQRNDEGKKTCIIQNLSPLLKEFKSEYQFLASRLLEYISNPALMEAPMVPNIARKVLEYFASFKWSCTTTEKMHTMIDKYVDVEDHEQARTSAAVKKFLDEYSHGRDFGRPISAAAMEGRDVAKAVMGFIRAVDREHHQHLQSQIQSVEARAEA